jgi:hypothetical protein
VLADLQCRLQFVAVVLLAGLVILLIHLAFYPWPDRSATIQASTLRKPAEGCIEACREVA